MNNKRAIKNILCGLCVSADISATITIIVPKHSLISNRFNCDVMYLYKTGAKLMAAISDMFNQNNIKPVLVDLIEWRKKCLEN